MTIFDKREQGFEQEFAHDEELRFKIIARRNKLLGLWAAEKLGFAGAAAQNYAKEVVDAYLGEIGERDVFNKLRKGFDAVNVNVSDAEIQQVMNELLSRATALIQAGK